MEENKELNFEVEPDEQFKITALVVNEETGEAEILMYNKNLKYIPTEYQLADYRNSWKKCHCGRQTWFNDNWCPACGQHLGMPNIYDD